MMHETIKNFHQQFSYKPEIKNAERLAGAFQKFIVAGMGGSNLVADLLRIRDPYIDILVHKNYGIPKISEEELRNRLLIANSYSGNTEETVDALLAALSRKLPAAVIATGGQLMELAITHRLPYIRMPSTGIQPRSALGFNIKAIVTLMGREDLRDELTELARSLHPSKIEPSGKALAEKLHGFVPVVYASTENVGIAYNWKIKFNETGKIPAFFNMFSELNHNEMTGFDIKEGNRKLAKKFYFIFLKDRDDDPRIQKRMDILEKLYRDRGLPVAIVDLRGSSVFHKIFASLILADWAAYYTARQYGLEPEHVPMVEEFKQLTK